MKKWFNDLWTKIVSFAGETKKKLQGLIGVLKKKETWSKKRIIAICAGAGVVVIAGCAIAAFSIWRNPMGQFENVAAQMTLAPVETSVPVDAVETSAPTPTPTLDPYQQLLSQADQSILNHIVNIMLIGVDYAPERDTWSGKHAYHSDVMIVLSINTDTKEVNMISLPRDTYAKIPDVDGIYKLNASIDCGGGWPTEAGFQEVCKAATWMLGGIPVQYYYAVDMSAVKGLVNTIDGVDFDVDIPFEIMGRSYETGMQHMDGQAVLDYLRVRKNLGSESGDLNRIDRQKRMLVAIFEKLKQSNMLVKVPGIIDAFNGNLYTNTTIAQTAGLAAFAYNVDSDKITMNSMGGGYANIFNWNFVVTDQKKRVDLIKKVYGVDVPQYKDYAYSAASLLWEQMQAEDINEKSKKILSQIKPLLDADALLPEYIEPTPTPSVPPTTDPNQVPVSPAAPADTTATATATSAVKGNLTYDLSTLLYSGTAGGKAVPLAVAKAPAGYRQYGADVWDVYNRAVAECSSILTLSKQEKTDQLKAANLQTKADIEQLCSIFSIGVPSWRVNYEKNDNEIFVDFN